MEARKISREELHQLVWSKPMTALAKQFEISDVGLRKICKKLNVPLPKAGHWQRVKAGRKVRIVELPTSTSNEVVTLQEINRADNRKEYPWSKLQLEIESDPKLNLIVPDRLNNPDDLIVDFKNYLAARQKTKRDGGYVDWQNRLDISVPNELMQRALVFMDTFIKLGRARGHSFEVSSSATYVVIRDRRIEIKLMERSRVEVVPKKPGDYWPTRNFLSTGKLVFVTGTYDRVEWLDGKRKIEERLSNIFARLETKINMLHEHWRLNRIREEEEERRLQVIREQEQRKQKELKDFKNLLNKSVRWQRVKILRDYIADAERRAASTDSVSDEFKSWVDWANKKADWYDPHLDAEDPLLQSVNKDSLSFPSA